VSDRVWSKVSSLTAIVTRDRFTEDWPRLSYPRGMLFLKPLNLHRESTCTHWDVGEGKPNGRPVGRIYKAVEAGGQRSGA
jgi:hypothetical protein